MRKIFEKIDINAIYLIFCIGIVLNAWTFTRPFAIAITPILLAVLTYISIEKSINTSKKFYVLIFTLFIFTLTIEIIGVYTGKIFGEYSYGNGLQPQILGVPVMIGLNWVSLILSGLYISNYLTKNNLLAVLITSILVTFFDYIMEPVAISLKYWRWELISVPFQNYLTWFVISIIVSSILISANILFKKNNLIVHYFIAQLLFFYILNIVI